MALSALAICLGPSNYNKSISRQQFRCTIFRPEFNTLVVALFLIVLARFFYICTAFFAARPVQSAQIAEMLDATDAAVQQRGGRRRCRAVAAAATGAPAGDGDRRIAAGLAAESQAHRAREVRRSSDKREYYYCSHYYNYI